MPILMRADRTESAILFTRIYLLRASEEVNSASQLSADHL